MQTAPSLTNLDKSIEWALCAKSRDYFINEHCHIFDPVGKEWIPFHLWPFQSTILGDVASHQLTVALKARQLGMTWLLGDAYPLHQCLFEPIAYCLLFSLTEDEAKDMLARLVGMYERLPDWMKRQCPITQQNTTSLTFANGSRVRAYPTTRGDSNAATYAIVDEADLVPDLDVMIGRIKPTIDAGGKLVLLSRVDKRNPKSFFKEVFTGAQKGQNNYHPIFIPWYAHPKRDAAWYEAKKREYIRQDDLWEQYPATEAEALAMGYAGLVYPNFSPTGNVSLEADYDPAYPVEWWVDVGYTNPTAILFAQWRPHRGFPDCICIFDVVYESQRLPRDLIELALAKPYAPPDVMVYDAAAPIFAAEFITVRNQRGLRGNVKASLKGVDENIKNARNYIGDANNPRLLQIHPRCGVVIDELMLYHYKKTGLSASGEFVPERVDSHSCDALAYGLAQKIYRIGG